MASLDYCLPPIVWRSLTFERHSRGVWLTADGLWKLDKLDTSVGERWLASLQLSGPLLKGPMLVVDTGDTPSSALDRLVCSASEYALKLRAALDQI